MTYKVYLRLPNQKASIITTTESKQVATEAFLGLLNLVKDAQDNNMIAVFSESSPCGSQHTIAHHVFLLNEEGKPIDPSNNWRHRINELSFLPN